MLSAFNSYALAVGEDGSLWEWGTGSPPAIMPRSRVTPPTPTRVPGMTGVVSVSTSDNMFVHALALMEDGTVRAWGDNTLGQLGDGTMLSREAPATVPGLTDVVAIAAGGGASFAVRADGTLWAWGASGNNGTGASRATPAPVPGLTGVVAVSAGYSHVLALREDGTVWAWGENWAGQLGDGTFDARLQPAPVPGLTDVVAIDARAENSYALRADGTVWGWGSNFTGQASGTTEELADVVPIPTQVPGLTHVRAVAAGNGFAVAVRRDGTVWNWGLNNEHQLGRETPGEIGAPGPVPNLHAVEAVTAGISHTLALRRDGTLWAWGDNLDGVMGTGSDRRLSPVAVVGLTGVRAVDAISGFNAMLAVREDGTVWTWGGIPFTNTRRPVPERVEGVEGVVAASSYYGHTLALRTDGTVWTWGQNQYGELGDGTTVGRKAPAPVPGLSGVVGVATGSSHSLALRADGTVWAWGRNQYGQLGDLTLQSRSTPVRVQGLEGVVALFASGDLSVALRGDGTVWQWGSSAAVWNQGDRQPRAPELVQGLSDVVTVAARPAELVAVRADGTVWQWLLRPPGSTLPAQQVPGFTDAVSVARGAQAFQVLRADGTVWNTGSNLSGERGFPTEEAFPAGPSQVPGLTGVVALTAGSSFFHALRADGTLVGWGLNTSGVIGDGVSPLHPEPTRVPLPCKLKGPASDVAGGRRCDAAP